jgi:ankyrin repeat protein
MGPKERGSGSGSSMPSGSSLMALQLIDAAKRQKVKLVKRLLNAGAPYDTRDGAGRTALHYAAALQSTEVLRALLAAGAGAHLADADGCLSPTSPRTSGTWLLLPVLVIHVPDRNTQRASVSCSLQPTEQGATLTSRTCMQIHPATPGGWVRA